MHLSKSAKLFVSFTTSIIILLSNTTTIHAFTADNYVSRLTEPSNDTSAEEYRYYYSNENAFASIGYGIPNCTAYAWGRAFELLGEKPKLTNGNAGRWYTYNINNGYYAYGSQPKLGAVACWDNYDNINGHVAVVEQVHTESGFITTSESQWQQLSFALYTYQNDSSDHMSRYRFLGYIYIDDASGKFYGDTFQLYSQNTNKYITVNEDVQPVVSSKCYETVKQDFRFEPAGDGSYRLWSSVYNKVLTRNGDSIYLSDSDESENSLWTIYDGSDGQYTLSAADDTENVITVSDNGSIYMDQYKKDPSQLFDIKRMTGLTDLETTRRADQLTVDSSEAKTQYYPDEILDLTDIALSIDGNKIETLDLTKLSPVYDFESTGMTDVTIHYGSLSASYQVYVAAPITDSKSMNNVGSAQNSPDVNDILSTEITTYLSMNTTESTSEDLQKFDINNDSTVNISDAVCALANVK
ncbi:MAG: CHAP domain-containing protein [Oscillospiraceae bacterium]|nr:CHAP domain-containing protein [Oscillospiraceae bacterium]